MNELMVLGAPRSGFTLLISILSELLKHKKVLYDVKQKMVNSIIDSCSVYLKNEMFAFFEQRIDMQNYMYNGEFDLLVGGPKWIDGDESVIRKYVGIKGKGDFTFLLYLPKYALNYNFIVHSHYNPKHWVDDSYYDCYQKFASIRNPMGTVNSAVFSINAITSEYISKFIPELHEEEFREKMAVYKLTDLEMFEGLVKWLANYWKEFFPIRGQFKLFSWEEILSNPKATILSIAESRGIVISEKEAEDIWDKLDHKNLTQFHQYNYRKGGGIIGEWKSRLTNTHLDIFRRYGFDEYLEAFGYDNIIDFDESNYTAFQKKVAGYISKGEICNEVDNPDLFVFNWNKSNIAQTSHAFKRYDRVGNIQIERSSMDDSDLIEDFSCFAQKKADYINDCLKDFYSLSESFDILQERYREILTYKSDETEFRYREAMNEKEGQCVQ